MQSIKKCLSSLALILLSFATIFLFSACGSGEKTLKGLTATNSSATITYGETVNEEIFGLKLRYSDGSEEDFNIENLTQEDLQKFSYSIKKMREVPYGQPVYEDYEEERYYSVGQYEITIVYDDFSVTVYLHVNQNEQDHDPATVSLLGGSTMIYSGNKYEPKLTYDNKLFGGEYDGDAKGTDLISYRFLYAEEDSENEYWSWNEYGYEIGSTWEDDAGSYKLVAELTTKNHGTFYTRATNFTVNKAQLTASDWGLYKYVGTTDTEINWNKTYYLSDGTPVDIYYNDGSSYVKTTQAVTNISTYYAKDGNDYYEIKAPAYGGSICVVISEYEGGMSSRSLYEKYDYAQLSFNEKIELNTFEYSFDKPKLSDYLCYACDNLYIVNTTQIDENTNLYESGAAYQISNTNEQQFEFISVSSTGLNDLTINSDVIAQNGDYNYRDYTIGFKFTLNEKNYKPIQKSFTIRIKKQEVEVSSLTQGIQLEYDGTAKTPNEILSSFKLLPTTDGKVFEEVNGNYELVYDYNGKAYIKQSDKELELGKTYYQQKNNEYIEATLGFFGYEFYSVWDQETQTSTEYLTKIYSITNSIGTDADTYNVLAKLLKSDYVSNRVILKKLVPTVYSVVDENHHNEGNYFIRSGSYYDDITADISYNEGEGDQTTTIFKYYVYEKIDETTYEKTSDDEINWNKTYYLYEGSEYVEAVFYYISTPEHYVTDSSFNLGSWKITPKAYHLTYDIKVNGNPIEDYNDNGGNFVLTYDKTYTFSVENLKAYFTTTDTEIDFNKTYYLYDGTAVNIYYYNGNGFVETKQPIEGISTYYAEVDNVSYKKIKQLDNHTDNYIHIDLGSGSSMTLYECDTTVSLGDTLTLTALNNNDEKITTGITINEATIKITDTSLTYFKLKLEFNLNSTNYAGGNYLTSATLKPTAVATQATIEIRSNTGNYNANYGGYVQTIDNMYYIFKNSEYTLLTSANIQTLLYEKKYTSTTDTAIDWNKTYYLNDGTAVDIYYNDGTNYVPTTEAVDGVVAYYAKIGEEFYEIKPLTEGGYIFIVIDLSNSSFLSLCEEEYVNTQDTFINGSKTYYLDAQGTVANFYYKNWNDAYFAAGDYAGYYIYKNGEDVLLTPTNSQTLLYEQNGSLTTDTTINWNKTYYLDSTGYNSSIVTFYYYDRTKLVCEYGTELYQIDNYVYYDGQEKTVEAEMTIEGLEGSLTLVAIQQKNGDEWETVAEGQNASVSEAGEYRAVFTYNYYTIDENDNYTYYMLTDENGNYLNYIYCEFEIKQGKAITANNNAFSFTENGNTLTPTDNQITINSENSVNFEVTPTRDSNYLGQQYVVLYDIQDVSSETHYDLINQAGTYYLRALVILEPGYYLVNGNNETITQFETTITVVVTQ